MYSKVCLWLRGQEIHLGGNWNGLLKGENQYSCFFFSGGSYEITFTCLVMFLQGCAELPGNSHEWQAEIYTRSLTYAQWQFSTKGSAQTVHADSNSVTCVSMNVNRWKKRAGAAEDGAERWTGELMRRRLLLDLITVKHWTLIGDIKTFYESSCFNLQHYNSVAVQNKSAAAL